MSLGKIARLGSQTFEHGDRARLKSFPHGFAHSWAYLPAFGTKAIWTRERKMEWNFHGCYSLAHVQFSRESFKIMFDKAVKNTARDRIFIDTLSQKQPEQKT